MAGLARRIPSTRGQRRAGASPARLLPSHALLCCPFARERAPSAPRGNQGEWRFRQRGWLICLSSRASRARVQCSGLANNRAYMPFRAGARDRTYPPPLSPSVSIWLLASACVRTSVHIVSRRVIGGAHLFRATLQISVLVVLIWTEANRVQHMSLK